MRPAEPTPPRPLALIAYVGKAQGKLVYLYRCAECGHREHGPDVGPHGRECDHSYSDSYEPRE